MDEKRCEVSPRALVQDIEGDIVSFVPVVKSSWGGETISLLLEPDDPSDPPFLSSLLNASEKKIIAAYQYNVALGRIIEATSITEKQKNQWEFKIRSEVTEFSPSMEMAFSSTSADELAEMRARRLLLNENPSKMSNDLNEITRELFIQGMETALRVEKSPFPAIFHHYGSNPQRFLEIAWILAIMQLKLSGAIAQVEKLRLTLTGNALKVEFVGRRRKQYSNAPAYVMRIDGVCPLNG